MLQPIDLIQELATHPQVSQTPPREHLLRRQRRAKRFEGARITRVRRTCFEQGASDTDPENREREVAASGRCLRSLHGHIVPERTLPYLIVTVLV
jgi:hypothetical protein